MRTLLLFLLILPALHADDVLFIGNSFTYVNRLPNIVAAIAASKGRTAETDSITKGGQGWSYHLSTPATDTALESKPWNWVVLQDYSLDATHAGDAGLFMKNGETFYDRIASEAPKANILLYETWAYSPHHPAMMATASAPPKFTSADEMSDEIRKNYEALGALLQARDANRHVLVAPVGAAFEQCAHLHPEINLYARDFKHPDKEGSYLAALVIYSTLFHDTPEGAATGDINPGEARILQDIAAAVTAKK